MPRQRKLPTEPAGRATEATDPAGSGQPPAGGHRDDEDHEHRLHPCPMIDIHRLRYRRTARASPSGPITVDGQNQILSTADRDLSWAGTVGKPRGWG